MPVHVIEVGACAKNMVVLFSFVIFYVFFSFNIFQVLASTQKQDINKLNQEVRNES